MLETISLRRSGRVAQLILNRPDVRNAFNAKMIAEITASCAELASDDTIAVVVLSGNGRLFSAGADINWMRSSLDYTRAENLDDALRMSDMFHALNVLPQALVARVHGAALGGGMGLIAVCDVVIAANDTVFGFTEAKLGIIPAVIGRFVVPRIGTGWARALFLTAERFDVETARSAGLVHWTSAADELDAAVDEKVGELLSSGPRAVREAKALVRELANLDYASARDFTASRIAELRVAPEGQEGLRAFVEKRRPSWRSEVE